MAAKPNVTLAVLLLVGLIIGQTAVVAGPKIQHWTTENGARVYYVPAPQLPMVDIRIVFDAGAARDGDKPGLALLTNGLIAEGTKTMDANQIAEKFDELGAQFGNDSQRDMASVELRTLTETDTLHQAVDTVAEILKSPTFPKEAFQRERNRLLVALKSRQQSPGEIAEEAFYKAIYGSHPYHVMPEGTKDSVNSITLEDIKAYHKRYYVAGNAVIAIVGDLDRKGAEKIAERVIGKLPKGKPAAKLPEVTQLKEAKNIVIPHPSVQSHILTGQPGMSREDPDYFPLYVGNHILGGSGLVSRISDEIREKRGLAYSSYSYFLPMAKKGPFRMGLQTRNDQVDEAMSVLLDTLKTFIEKGPTKAELELAKKNITGGFALRLDSNSKIANYIMVIGFYDLSLDYLDNFVKQVEAVTLEQIQDAFKRRIHPDKLARIIVGTRQQAAQRE